jgi:hypothetical protein
VTDPRPDDAETEAEARSDTERAEAVVEQWAERVGDWVVRIAVRAREEAEDIWAEAQSVHRGERQ